MAAKAACADSVMSAAIDRRGSVADGQVHWPPPKERPHRGESGIEARDPCAVQKIDARGSPSRRFLRRGGVPIPPPRQRSGRCRPAVSGLEVRPATGSRAPSGGAAGCTTQRHNAHVTGPEEHEVAYAWHPWAGRLVRVHNVIRRPTGAIARCTMVDGEPAVRTLEIPKWMLDAACCRHMRRRTEPVTSVDALQALRTLLAEVSPSRGGDEVPDSAAVPSAGEKSGGHHGRQPSPNSTEPYARSVCAESTDLGPPCGADPPAGGRSSRACPDRARAQRDARRGEGHG